jgi:gluconolactonase
MQTRLRWVLALALAALPLAALADDEHKDKDKHKDKPAERTGTIGKIERHDAAFDKLLDKGAKLEKLAGGFAWTEGPAWDRKNKYLLFSDIPNNSVYKYDPAKEKGERLSLFLKPSGCTGKRTDLMEPGSNGLLFDPEGRLILMQHGNRQVARLREDGKSFKALAALYGTKRLNSPNDGVFDAKGNLYFTDPPYGQMRKGKPWVFPDMELKFKGVYRLAKDGKLTLLTREMTFPNGIGLSPDGKTLYVANSDPQKAIWMSYPVQDDGKLGHGKVFFDATKWVKKKKGLPDGLKVDRDGNVWATGPGGVLVFSPAGKHLGTIATGVNTGNCVFGDDGSTLYVMCDKEIGRIKTKAKGLGFE